VSRQWALVALLAVLAVAAGVWIADKFEKKEFEVTVGFRGEARSNPMLAAGRFLRRMGIPAQELQAHEWSKGPPPAQATLLLATARWSLDQERVDALLDWVEAGGHLIVAARPDPSGTAKGSDASDPLLKALGIEIQRYGEAGELAEIVQTIADKVLESRKTTTVDFDAGEHPVEVAFSPRQRLATEADYDRLAEDDLGSAVLHASLGSGSVTVLCDIGPLQNASIGKHGHAELLWRLVRLGPVGAPVWIVFDEDMPALPAWLWRHAREAVIALVLLLLAFMWNRARRFGPLIDLPPPARRRLLEHVEASGQFLWRNGERQYLIEAVRRAVDAAAARRHPGWESLPPDERTGRIADVTGLPETLVHQALSGAGHGHKHSFTHTIRDLERIRRRL